MIFLLFAACVSATSLNVKTSMLIASAIGARKSSLDFSEKLLTDLGKLQISPDMVSYFAWSSDACKAFISTTAHLSKLVDKLTGAKSALSMSSAQLATLRPSIALAEQDTRELKLRVTQHALISAKLAGTAIYANRASRTIVTVLDKIIEKLTSLSTGSSAHLAAAEIGDSLRSLSPSFEISLLNSQELVIAKFSEDLIMMSPERMHDLMVRLITFVKSLGLDCLKTTAFRSGPSVSSNLAFSAVAESLPAVELTLAAAVNMLITLLGSIEGRNVRTDYICNLLGEFMMASGEDKVSRDELVHAMASEKSKLWEIRNKRLEYRVKQVASVGELLAALRLLENRAP